ncbi:MAG: hypothetical protein JNL74_22980 [Fibrobacteres bacterium]|nr:hypothetical protein [Fibrobacterota bacterium]
MIKVLILFFVTFVFAAGNGDFIIVNDVSKITLLDKFQQRVSGGELKQFQGATPFQIIKRDETLGDEITVAHRVMFNNRIFFIVSPPKSTELKNCRIINDTINVDNNRYLRVIENKGETYLVALSTGITGGWRKLSSSDWSKESKQPESKEIKRAVSQSDISRLKDLLQSVNNRYTEYFDFFNGKEGRSISTPSWVFKLTDNNIECVFSGDESLFKALSNSTEILTGQISSLFLGQPYSVSIQDRMIMVKHIPDASE